MIDKMKRAQGEKEKGKINIRDNKGIPKNNKEKETITKRKQREKNTNTKKISKQEEEQGENKETIEKDKRYKREVTEKEKRRHGKRDRVIIEKEKGKREIHKSRNKEK